MPPDLPRELTANRADLGTLWPDVQRLADATDALTFDRLYNNFGAIIDAEVLQYLLGGKDISEVLAMPVSEAHAFFAEGEDNMISLDDPQHATQRKLVARRFTPKAVRALEREVVQLALQTLVYTVAQLL